MTDPSDLRSSAEAISVEIGLDLSYFTDESERNFLPLAVPIGYLLLHWFIEGLVTGAGEAAGEKAVKRLGTRVGKLFGRRDTTPEQDTAVEKELAAGTQAALAKARQVLAANSADEATLTAEAYERALIGYLTGNGMPVLDAVRIAQRVRAEAGIQLRRSPEANPRP
ncbi:MAG: hypothetical protein ACRDN0_22085 [Trebonia sp.]